MKSKVLDWLKIIAYCLGYMLLKSFCIVGGFIMMAVSMFIVWIHYEPEHFGFECRFCGAKLLAICLFGLISFIVCVASIVSLSETDNEIGDGITP